MKVKILSYLAFYFVAFSALLSDASWLDSLFFSGIFLFYSFMGVVFAGIFTSRLSSPTGEKRFSFAFYKVVSFFLFGFLGESLSYYAYSIALYVLWLLAIAFIAYIYRREWIKYLRKSSKEVFQVEVLFTLFFFIALVLFGFRGTIFGGEKPMDFQFLHIYQKLPAAPHWEPWSWGERIKYYVLGYRLYGLLFPRFLFSVDVQGHFYPIVHCLAFTQFFLSLYAFFYSYVRKIAALLGGVILAFSPNIVSVLLAVFGPVSFENFWKASRLFEGGKFTEFPLWSFLFGDLHPHFMATPLVVSIFSLFTYLRIKSREHQFFPYALCGILMATLVGLNVWDALVLITLILLELLFSGRIFYLTQQRLSREYVIFMFFFITLSLGFLTQVGKRGDVRFGIAQENINTLQNYFWHYGFFQAPLLCQVLRNQ